MLFLWIKRLLATVVLLVAAGFLLFHSSWFERRYVYPFPYRDVVFQYATQNQLDPYLVAGVIYAESKFNPQACSPKGARGLMQLIPDTAEWVAQQHKMNDFAVEMLDDPEMNIRLGTWYLASLQKDFNRNDVLMLAAYNGGRGNVQKWIRQNNWTLSFQDYRQIPFRETRDYVGRVILYRQKYQQLYAPK